MQTLNEDEELVDALPTIDMVAKMPIDALVATMHSAVANSDEATAPRIAAAACLQLAVLIQRPGMDEVAAQAGSLAATVACMGAYGDAVSMQSAGCELIAFVCLGGQDEGADAEATHRLALALHAGCLEAIVRALNGHAESSEVLQRGIMALSVLAGRDGSMRQKAAACGARREWLDAALQLAGGAPERVPTATRTPSADEDGVPDSSEDEGEDPRPLDAAGAATSARLDALVDSALCALCDAFPSDEVMASLMAQEAAAPTGLPRHPRQWLADLLLQEGRPVPAPALEAVDKVFLAEAEAQQRRTAVYSPPHLPSALWLPKVGSTQLCAWRGDIRELAVGAVVNAANERGLGCFRPSHVCIDSVLHRAAGPRLREECRQLMASRGPAGLAPGDRPLLTSGYHLAAQHVLHVTGPTIQPPRRAPTPTEVTTLQSCYTGCLEAAAKAQLRSVAFCCLSTGLFGYPHAAAAEHAVGAVTAWLASHPACGLDFVVFDVFTDVDARSYADATAAARKAGMW